MPRVVILCLGDQIHGTSLWVNNVGNAPINLDVAPAHSKIRVK